MEEKELLRLLHELKAIRFWDELYRLADSHDETDRCAWEHQRELEAGIYFKILTEVSLRSANQPVPHRTTSRN
jgi:hypothetical protein